MRYDDCWSSALDAEEFGQRLSYEWVDAYVAAAHADLDDLVEVDPGNGFRYTFDFAGSLRGVDAGRDPTAGPGADLPGVTPPGRTGGDASGRAV